MLAALTRKARQLADDPVLRRWLVARALRLTPGEPPFVPHHPPYLGEDWPLPPEAPTQTLPELAAGTPHGTPTLRLSGATLTVEDPDQAVSTDFPDIETRLSLHRFAWVPLLGTNSDPRWVGTLWHAWARRFGTPDDTWAWHPYTAAERAINLLDFAARHGLPAGAADLLAAHAPAIARGLEWFGDHHTSNHCANNGRGLYLLGLALGLPQATAAGARILLEEGQRIFRPVGVLREASTHYHLLLTRQWASVWLAARRARRPETAAFEAVLARALSVLPHLVLPGGLPLVGDVSPDCPPDHLFGLLPGGDPLSGWTGALIPAERQALLDLRAAAGTADADSLAAEGWLRGDFGPWSGLWHAEPAGWSPMPGHGHQDCGAAEIHFEGVPVFVDPGRGSYEQAGEADPFVASGVHGGLTLDGIDPFPPNKPYYAPDFRARMAGPARLSLEPGAVSLEHGGYVRLGAPRIERRWSFAADGFRLDDRVEGHGTHTVSRRLITGLPVRLEDGGAVLALPDGRRLRVTADGPPLLAPITLWSAYGVGRPGTRLEFSTRTALPWRGHLSVEVR